MPAMASSCLLSYFILLQKITLSLTAGEITVGPSQNVTALLGDYKEFQCRSARSAPRWIVNDMDLDPVERQYRQERGIWIVSHIQMGSTNYVSVLQVHAVEINNNTAIQCAVYTGDARSERVLLTIQGRLSSPGLTAKALNFSTVHLSWTAPYTLNVTGNNQSSILGYNILIKNETEEILMINSTTNEYFYNIEEDDEDDEEVVCVAAMNGVGIGQYSEPLTFSLAFVTLSGPNSSILNTARQFSCEAFCHESLLIAWLVNGTFLRSHLRNSKFTVMTRSVHAVQCSIDVLEVLTDSLGPFTVQCAAVYACLDLGKGVAGCRSQVYYSQTVQVETNESLHTSDHDTFTGTTISGLTDMSTIASVEGKKTRLIGVELTIGTAAGITVFFCIVLIFILGIFICKKKRKAVGDILESSNEVINTGNEVVYELCGDPVPPTNLHHQARVSPEMVIYDSITQSQLVDTKPCVAYGSTHPVMEPCVAYAARKEV